MSVFSSKAITVIPIPGLCARVRLATLPHSYATLSASLMISDLSIFLISFSIVVPPKIKILLILCHKSSYKILFFKKTIKKSVDKIIQ